MVERHSEWPGLVPVSVSGFPSGIVAVGGELNPEVLLAAYSRGIFPWPSEGNRLFWWSPDPRLVLRSARMRVTRSLRKTLRHSDWNYTLNERFSEVIHCCSASRPGRESTWITPELRDAYCCLHDMGFAHSLEVSDANGCLCGGLYGVGLGRMFFGESMFCAVRDASKAALYQLCSHLSGNGVPLIDCQIETPHLRSLGGELMTRSNFCSAVQSLCSVETPKKLWMKQNLNYHVCVKS